MAYVKISNLNFAQPLTGNEIIPVVQNGTSYKVSVSAVGGTGDTENINGQCNDIGTGCNFSSIVGGEYNDVYGNCSFIGGGKGNVLSADFGFIGSGCNNSISKISNHGIILGGGGNCIDGRGNTYPNGVYKPVSNVIVAGAGNEILSGSGNFIHNSRESSICCSTYSTIFGSKSCIYGGTHSSAFGNINFICQGSTGRFNCIGGGSSNKIEQICSGSVISNIINGGQSNCIINGTSNVIGGGSLNKIFDPLSGDSNFSVIGGGNNNIAGTGRASILGGGLNKNYGINSSILGGFEQTICGGSNYSMLGAGSYNTSFSGRSDILGGKFNLNKGQFSTIINGVSSVINSGHDNTIIAGTHICTVSSNMLHANTLYLSAAALPTIDPGVPGVVWRDGTNLKISV